MGKYPEKCIPNQKISMQYGAFPFCYWNGGLNFNKRNEILTTYESLYSTKVLDTVPYNIDCSNLLLTKDDVFDVHQNIILERFDKSGNFITITNLDFYDALKQKFPYYQYIISEKLPLLYSITLEDFNELIQKDEFRYILVPYQFLQQDICTQIQYKHKAEIIIGDICFNCKKYKDCIYLEQEYNYNFSEQTVIKQCSYSYSSQEFNDLVKFYISLGFNHFRIAPTNESNLSTFNNFLTNIFILPQYIGDFYDFVRKYYVEV